MIYYSSVPSPFEFNEFMKLEVSERQNYTEEQVQEWINKYNLKTDALVIWVSDIKWVANRYNLSADEWDTADQVPENKMDVYEYSSKKGYIIPESDDGENGFLFVFY